MERSAYSRTVLPFVPSVAGCSRFSSPDAPRCKSLLIAFTHDSRSLCTCGVQSGADRSHHGVSRSTQARCRAGSCGQPADGKLKTIPQTGCSAMICPALSFAFTGRSRTVVSRVCCLTSGCRQQPLSSRFSIIVSEFKVFWFSAAVPDPQR